MNRHAAPIALAALALLAATGCVRESVAADAAEYHFKWWSWLWGLVALGIAGVALARHPTTWIDGAWRPWWTFRGWGSRDLVSFFGCLALAVIMPVQTAGRLEVDGLGIVRSNALGLKPTRTTPWSEVARLDFSTNAANLDVAERIKQARRSSKPSLVAVLKNGDTVELGGWLVDAATPEIIRRARTAGVPLVAPPAGADAEAIWDDLVPNLNPADPAANPAIPAADQPAGAPPNVPPPARPQFNPPQFNPQQRPVPPNIPPQLPPHLQQRIDEMRERHEQRLEEMRERQRQFQLPGGPQFERPEPPNFDRPAGAF
jgi:hypothetical protein